MIRFEAIKINDLDQFLAQKGSANKARRHKKALEIQVQLGTPVNHGALKLPAIDVRQLQPFNECVSASAKLVHKRAMSSASKLSAYTSSQTPSKPSSRHSTNSTEQSSEDGLQALLKNVQVPSKIANKQRAESAKPRKTVQPIQRSIKLNKEQSLVKIQLELPQIHPLQSKPSTDTEALDQVQLERLNFTDLPSIYKRYSDES